MQLNDKAKSLTSSNDFNLNSLLGRLVVAALVVLGGLDGSGEEGVDEGGLAESRLACRYEGERGARWVSWM